MPLAKKNILLNILLLFFSIMVSLLMVEIGIRIVYKDIVTSHVEFRRSRPEPYARSPFFSKEFSEEQEVQLYKTILE